MSMNANKLFEDLKARGYRGLESMITDGQEEHLYLDFKEKSDPLHGRLNRDDKHNLAKALSGFSNAEGGTIIWGIKASKTAGDDRDIARELKPISEVTIFLTNLNQLLSNALAPLHSGVFNHPITVPGDSSKGFVLTYVPASDIPPHRAELGVGQYYLRVGESFMPMEHYQIADFFGRRRKPDLNLVHDLQGHPRTANSAHVRVSLTLKNVGHYLAKYPALQISSQLQIARTGINSSGEWGLLRPQRLDATGYALIGGADSVIHPEMSTLVCYLEHPRGMIDRHTVSNLPEDYFHVKYRLYAENCPPKEATLQISRDQVINLLP